MIYQEPVSKVQPYKYTQLILLLVLLLAGLLRFAGLGQISPPGLNQDEAQNAWSSYCLLKTGKNYSGASWPIFYTRGLGDNSPALYIYLLLPFQAIGGMSIYTTRLPAAVLGVFTVLAVYFVGRRLFDEKIGLLAALFLALNPWHIQQSRWGHEASVASLLGLAPLALMLLANLPVSDTKNLSPRPVVAALAGALTGICCYGYQALRLFIPAFLLATILSTLPNWRQNLKPRNIALAAVLFITAFAVFVGPLAWQHIFHPQEIGRHLLHEPDRIGLVPLTEAIKNIAVRYIWHFVPFKSNCYSSPQYMLPLMLAGLIILFRKFRLSPSAGTLLVFLIAYPVGDCLSWSPSIFSTHYLRSSPGLCSLTLLGAVGAVGAFRWLWKQNHILSWLFTVILVISMTVSHTRHFRYFYGAFNRRPEIYHDFHTDLVEACQWLRPRLNDFDAVFCTTKGFNMPYVITTVVLGYDPKQWLTDGFDITTEGQWDYYTRYGKMYFMYDKLFKPPVEKTYPPGRTLFIVRPGELNFENLSSQLVHKIIGPDGKIALLLYQL
jgi:4-amino-4-deoxy-L-arabinose transferase-like glycosyltransferase